jgi:hypothetical protein
MPASISCADCRATVKKFNKDKEPNCDKCYKEKIIPGNIVVYNIICQYAPVIWDGESVSATGIQLALEWSYIDEENHPDLAKKIISYFVEVKKQHAAKAKAQQVKKTPSSFKGK